MSSTTCREGAVGGGASRLRGRPRPRLAPIGPEDSRTDPLLVIAVTTKRLIMADLFLLSYGETASLFGS